MSHTPHGLAELFPEQVDQLHTLKLEEPHFARFEESYHHLNRAIHRAESDIEPVSDSVMEDMKKRRLALLDEIAERLNA